MPAPDPVIEANLWSTQQLAAPFEGYKMRTFVLIERGVVLMPVAGADGVKAKVVKTCSTYGKRVVACVARRTGKKPSIPPREADTEFQIWQRDVYQLDTFDVLGDGDSLVYQFSVVRHYLLLSPFGPDDGGTIHFGQPPMITGSATANYLDSTDLDPTQVAGTAWVSTGGGGPMRIP